MGCKLITTCQPTNFPTGRSRTMKTNQIHVLVIALVFASALPALAEDAKK